jgi:probable F420-dependent oxidoreductase
MDVGHVGIWTAQLDLQPAAGARAAAAELDELGFGALWIPEAVGREAMSHAAVLLDATERLVVATGVAVIFSRVPSIAVAAQRLLADDSGGRFLLGLGVSHAAMIEGMLGQVWDKPVTRMRDYLDAMDEAFTVSPPPADDPPRVLAALGPKMLELAATRARGALTYFVPVEHTAEARGHLGDGPMLLVEQAVVLESDADVARAIGRKHMSIYLTLPNYVNNLRRLGWGDDDLAGGGSDGLVDALVAWGDADAVSARVAAHHDAGADHVCIQVLGPDATALPLEHWRALAAALVAR